MTGPERTLVLPESDWQVLFLAAKQTQAELESKPSKMLDLSLMWHFVQNLTSLLEEWSQARGVEWDPTARPSTFPLDLHTARADSPHWRQGLYLTRCWIAERLNRVSALDDSVSDLIMGAIHKMRYFLKALAKFDVDVAAKPPVLVNHGEYVLVL